jgi:hypothetical protein
VRAKRNGCHTKDGSDVDRGVRQNHGTYKKTEVKDAEFADREECDEIGEIVIIIVARIKETGYCS